MKISASIVLATALFGASFAAAQMPPPPPPPAGPNLEGPSTEHREVRRVIIRSNDLRSIDAGPGEIRMVPRREHMGPMGFFTDTRSIERMTRGLDLTPQQLGKVTEHVETARQEMRKLSAEMAAETRRLRELSPDDAKYSATSADVAKKIGTLSSALVEKNAALRSKVWGVLTPEQRAKAATRTKEMRERIRERLQDGGETRSEGGPRGERPRVIFLEKSTDSD